MEESNKKNMLNPFGYINSHPGIYTDTFRVAVLFRRCVAMIAVFVFLSCAPAVDIKPKPVEIDSGNALFSKAEKMFFAKLYDRALELYQRFLFKFPDRPQTDDVLMRIAKIYEMKNEPSKARESYRRLTIDYPESPFFQNAMMRMLSILYSEGNYREVILNAPNALERTIWSDHIFRIQMLLGESYLALNQPEEAVNSFIVAYQQSKEEKRADVLQKLLGAISRLDTNRLIFLFKEVDDNVLNGYLLFQVASDYADEKKIEPAVKMLTLFIRKFPEHPKTVQAKILLEELEKKASDLA
ncbi:MAG: tetratricopeptide repeat protein [Desulfobacterales bacterium]